jgi:cell division GTPase FtsZ
MKERIAFICIGQAGGNVGKEFVSRGYFCHFINTSNEDLRSLTNVKDEFKFHIPSAQGCNKDRRKALMYAKDYYSNITNVIDSTFPMQDIIFFVFSLGGGTGSGISPAILDYMSKKNPHKHYGAIVILPSLDEPIKAQINALEAYQQLYKIGNLKTVFELDNENGDRFAINKNFVDMFDRLVNITKPDERGVIDGAELEQLLTCKGSAIMAYLDVPYVLGNRIEDSIENSKVFTRHKRGCQYIGLSLYNDMKPALVEELFGTPLDMYIGYNDNRNFVIATGMQMSTKDNVETRL